MRLLCVGLNHKTAPVSLREHLAFDPAQADLALRGLRQKWSEGQFVIVSTCNRSEIYALRPLRGRPREDELQAFPGEFHNLEQDSYAGSLYVLAEAEAVRHLFAVAAGLDSLVPGEDQIAAQLKAALRLAQSAGAAGPGLDELFQYAFNVAKHARAQTRIGAGKVSVAAVAAELAKQCRGDLKGKCVLSVGAGKTNSAMLRNLREAGADKILVTNRSAARAAELASAGGGQAVPFARMAEALAQADLVVCSTGASDPIITVAKVRAALAGREGRELLIIDIAVPRDVEEAVGQLPGVKLYNIDDLRALAEKNIAQRSLELDACGMIVDRHVAEYFHRLHVRQVAPVIEDLYRRVRDVADEEIAGASNRLTGDRQEDQKIIRYAFHRVLRRILHTPMTNLRAAAGTDAARQQAAALLKLFSLDRPEGQ